MVHNDMVSWRALSRWDFDAIVLSPGPGRPDRWHDFGVCSDILRSSEIPVLGICLGHQGLGYVLDGVVSSAPMVMHGRLSQVQHLDSGLFAGIPQNFSVVRYHSLAVTGPLGSEGRVTAWTDDGVVMGIEHRSRPLWGVQFHPESVASEQGRAVVENFYALARRHRTPRHAGARSRRSPAASRRAQPNASASKLGSRVAAAHHRRRAGDRAAVRAAVRIGRARVLAGQRGRAHEAGAALLSGHERRRGPLRAASTTPRRGWCARAAGGRRKIERGSIFDVLSRELFEREIEPPVESDPWPRRRVRRLPRLRVQGRLRLAGRAPLRRARRHADVRQPRRGGRSRRAANRTARAPKRERRQRRRRTLAGCKPRRSCATFSRPLPRGRRGPLRSSRERGAPRDGRSRRCRRGLGLPPPVGRRPQ